MPDSFPKYLVQLQELRSQYSFLHILAGVSCRHAAVQLYLCWKITQKEIASSWKATIRTINSWVKNYRANGVDGLKNKVQGPPVKISSELRKKLLKKRQENWKVPDLCQHFSLSK